MESEKLVAIVTGSAQGLGYAIVKELLTEGYRVCMADINEAKGNSASQELQKLYGNSNVIFRVCDVSQKSNFISVFEDVLKEFKRIDLLVNNAGIVDEREPRRTIDINLMGTLYGCEVALKFMSKENGGRGGIVLNVASIAGLIPAFMCPFYSASKHGVVGLTRSYGNEFHYEKSNVIFCALCPSYINTPMLEGVKDSALQTDEDVTKRRELLEPSYVAKAAMKLIKDKINGATLAVSEESAFGYKYIGLGELEDFQL